MIKWVIYFLAVLAASMRIEIVDCDLADVLLNGLQNATLLLSGAWIAKSLA